MFSFAQSYEESRISLWRGPIKYNILVGTGYAYAKRKVCAYPTYQRNTLYAIVSKIDRAPLSVDYVSFILPLLPNLQSHNSNTTIQIAEIPFGEMFLFKICYQANVSLYTNY